MPGIHSSSVVKACACLHFAVVLAAGNPSLALAQSYVNMNCDQLWHARNAIYAAKGYCFKTARAKSVFGPGCFPPYGQLTPAEQSQVGAIKQWEVHHGCGAGGSASAPTPIPTPAPGYASMNCNQLWQARNVIYAAKGYCFKTARAKSVFGPGCFPPYGQLTSAEQSRVDTIASIERAKSCR